jgi:hypothetical protein
MPGGWRSPAADGRAMPNEGLTTEQRRALQMLAAAPNGCTEPALRGHGFTVGLMVGLVGAGLAGAKPETMKAAGRSFGVVRFLITDRGRAALG